MSIPNTVNHLQKLWADTTTFLATEGFQNLTGATQVKDDVSLLTLTACPGLSL